MALAASAVAPLALSLLKDPKVRKMTKNQTLLTLLGLIFVPLMVYLGVIFQWNLEQFVWIIAPERKRAAFFSFPLMNGFYFNVMSKRPGDTLGYLKKQGWRTFTLPVFTAAEDLGKMLTKLISKASSNPMGEGSNVWDFLMSGASIATGGLITGNPLTSSANPFHLLNPFAGLQETLSKILAAQTPKLNLPTGGAGGTRR